MKLAVVGAGWAGMAAAVRLTQDGHQVTVFEAARAIGGRARALPATLPDGRAVLLDNGQHILIGAYRETLQALRTVGVDPQTQLLRLPLCLRFPDGDGLALPRWPAPLDALAGILGARGWTWADKASLLRAAGAWHWQGFDCPPKLTVAALCQGIRPRVMATLIAPLCVSALNTPVDCASGQVFLRVMRDALLGGSGYSNLLLPTTDLSGLFPQRAADWLDRHGGSLRLGQRVDALTYAGGVQPHWCIAGEPFDTVVWATSSAVAAAALADSGQDAPVSIAEQVHRWAGTAAALQFEAIATVYAHAPGLRLERPMLALRDTPAYPAQFVFDRGQLGGPEGLLAFVVSASTGGREALQAQVLDQAAVQLADQLHGHDLRPVTTVVEKRATFACTPALVRPPLAVAPGLLACGDYVQGPYPATLEGAVGSAHAVALALRAAPNTGPS